MKHLHELSPSDKTRLLAELDGWYIIKNQAQQDIWTNGSQLGWYPPSYDTSYDAIIPLVRKLDEETKGKVARQFVFLPNTFPCNRDVIKVIEATPSQLCDAVLVATGKAMI
jgi:hypothetical protein